MGAQVSYSHGGPQAITLPFVAAVFDAICEISSTAISFVIFFCPPYGFSLVAEAHPGRGGCQAQWLPWRQSGVSPRSPKTSLSITIIGKVSVVIYVIHQLSFPFSSFLAGKLDSSASTARGWTRLFVSGGVVCCRQERSSCLPPESCTPMVRKPLPDLAA